MRIADVEAIHLRLPAVEEIADGTQDVLLVRVTTDTGLVGIGEVSSQSYVCKAIIEAPRSAARRHGLREILVGQEAADPRALWNLMYHETERYGRSGCTIHAISGVDIALWDIKGQTLGQPVHALLGGKRRERVRAYASLLFGDTPDKTADHARDAVNAGLTAAKFGWQGFGFDEEADLAHLAAARKALGPDRDLMIDVGCIWDVETTLERAGKFEPFHLTWIEEPLDRDDLDGYGRLCPASPIPIAGGEMETTARGFREAIVRGKMSVVQPDVAICGGLTVCDQVSKFARKQGVRAVPHCFSTGVNLIASLHWIAAQPDGDLIEYCLRPSPLMRKLVANLPSLDSDGHVRVPDQPGLGIDLDANVLMDYRVA